MTVTNTPTTEVALGCWTILDDETDGVRATVTRERDNYTVRDDGGRILGRYPTPQQALASVAA
jgi:hypothetical protein